MYALIDCNNFYASCERLFRPDLKDKPIVVLSNNDGCVIARSNEAKTLGIKMGEPLFKIKALCKQKKVHAFSSNYVLYGDLSHRVMAVIEDSWPQVEQYSIDEAFLDLTTMPASMHDEFCKSLQKFILKSTGIPTSIGIGQTKTLAKAANYICKKILKIPVFNISNDLSWLSHVPIDEVWGVGRQWGKKLLRDNMLTACDLSKANIQNLKSRYNVILMRTAMELQGVVCNGFNELYVPKSIIASRSFGEMESQLEALLQAISRHAASAYRRLRRNRLYVKQISVFIYTNRFRSDLPQYNNRITFKLIHPTDDLRLIMRIAKRSLGKIFKPGFQYKKIGISFDELTDNTYQQLDFFNNPSHEDMHKKELLMNVLDSINHKFGRHTLKLAAEGFNSPCSMRALMKSPHYTTQWGELAVIRNKT